MHRFLLRHPGIDDVEEADELLMAMALHTLADDLAVKHIERREKGGDAVPLIVVGDGASTSLLHRQPRLGAVQRLSHGDLWVKMFRSDYIVNFLSLIGIQGLSPFA